MVKDQLFKEYPTIELVRKVLNAFGLKDLNDNTTFSRMDLKKRNTLGNIAKLKPCLEKCYIPCKARTYLNNLTEKNVVTILRQTLRHFGYNVFSKEKYTRGNKFIIYHIDKTPSNRRSSMLDLQKLKQLNMLNNMESEIKEKKPIIITFN